MQKRQLVGWGGLALGASSFLVARWHQFGTVERLSGGKPTGSPIPTLFIHGYAGTRLSTGPLIRRLTKRGWGQKTAVVRIKDKQHFKMIGDPSLPGSMVQVLFTNNRLNIMSQTMWLYHLLAVFHWRYRIDRVNIVAHSMGAVTVLRYLILYGQNPAVPLVNKVVMLGGPFNDTDPGKNTFPIEDYPLTAYGPSRQTPLYQWFADHQQWIDPQTQFLNIAGDIGHGRHSDGIVAVNSVLALRYLLPPVNYYEQVVVTGRRAAHSLLHENKEVDQLIGRFLFKR